jgi:hypothetical protein
MRERHSPVPVTADPQSGIAAADNAGVNGKRGWGMQTVATRRA